MPLLSILAAGLLAAPVPIKGRQAGPDRYPSEFLRSEKSAAAVLEIIISPEGKIVQCLTTETYGDAEFAKLLCKLQDSSSWSPATDQHKAPAYGLVRTLIRMFVPETRQGDEMASLAQLPDLQLTVNALPAPGQSYLDVKVSLKVDGSGSVTHCEPRPEQTASAAFAKIACDQASTVKFAGVLLESKALPGFVIEQKVRFEAEQPRAPLSP